jgi:uncharacterized protein (DUF427 family)
VEVRLSGVTIARSRDALELSESGYPPVIYVPKQDVTFDRLQATDKTTYCPFKGKARYWSIHANDTLIENAVWGYDQPYDEVASLKDHVAFYSDKVDVIA